MTITNIITPNDEYSLMESEVKKVRDCVDGPFFVKREGTTYLAHPSDVDQTSEAQVARYNRFKKNASFVGVPGQTLKAVVGKLKLDDATYELPDALEYLLYDIDKDGLSMTGMCECLAGEQVQVKWSLLVSDYQGLTDVDTTSVSVEELDKLNPRATINQYTRESVVDWAFKRINGRMQLVYVLLSEEADELDYNDSIQATGNVVDSDIQSYLKLALDEDGNYYQQKVVYGATSGTQEGEPNYPLVNKAPLNYLPVEVVSDTEFSGNNLPKQMGYLSGICDLVLERYNNDADYKEVMRNLKATTYIKGADSNFDEYFPKMNQNRTYIAVGGVNVLPGENIDVSVVSADDHTQAFERYKTQNEKEIRALGGVFPSDELRQRTATETVVEAANMTAMLNPMVSALEKGIQRSIGYCAVFEGLTSPDDMSEWAHDNIIVELPREFAAQKMTVEERKQLLMEYTSSVITKDTYLALLDAGGVIPDWEEELQALEVEPPRLIDNNESSTIEE